MLKKKQLYKLILLAAVCVFTIASSGCVGPNGPASVPVNAPNVFTTSGAPPLPFPTPTPTPTPTPSPTDSPVVRDVDLYALIVGINYTGTASQLNYCVKDAQNFRDALISSPLWNNAVVITLTANSDVTKSNIKKYMDDAAARLKTDGMFVFFYSGHGSNMGGTGYIIPYDGLTSLNFRIDENEMQTWLAAFPAGSKKFVAIDSCYSGLFIGKAPLGATPKFLKFEGSDDTYRGEFLQKAIDSVSNLVAVTACAGDEVSYETGQLLNGVMTYYLVDGIRPGTAIGPADVNGSGTITGQEAYNYAAPLAQNFAVNSLHANQHMQMQDNYTSGLIIKD